jgi:hypothetical protein
MILSRITKPTITRTALARNGTRQPQLSNVDADIEPSTSLNTSVESSRPAGTPICGHEPKKPRRPLGAYSVDISTAPPHSPPTPMPCAKRRTTSRTGASTPIALWVGRQPIRNVATPMISRDSTSIDLRPTRSPKCPKTMPPSGRAAKPTAYVLNARRVPTSGSASGKKSLSKTSAAAVPYKKKSYHSIVVPMKLAATTDLSDRVSPARCPPTRSAAMVPRLLRSGTETRPTHHNGRPNHVSESAPPASSSTTAPAANAAVTSRSTGLEESRVPRFP